MKYNGKTCKWDTVIISKTQELARFLLDRSKQVDFIEPRPSLQRSDTKEFRRRILELTQREAKELGIGKNTLHYLRRSTSNGRLFKVYRKVREKIELRP